MTTTSRPDLSVEVLEAPVSLTKPPPVPPLVPLTGSVVSDTPRARGAAPLTTATGGSVRYGGPPPPGSRAGLAGSALTLLAVTVLAFLVTVVLLSPVEHARTQRVAYGEFREDLAAVVAPTGQQDLDGNLLALGTPVALMTAPDLGLEREVVLEGTTAGVLRGGPGHKRNSVLPGQPGVVTLYGRAAAYSGPFSGVEDLRVGAFVRFTTGQGDHEYRVTGQRRAGDPLPAALAPGTGRLTMVSAGGWPFVPDEVVYVDAELISPVVAAPSRVLTAASLSPAEDAMATETAALLPILLFLQGGAVAALGTTWLARRWGRRQSWLVGFPVVGAFLVLASREAVRLLPNLL